MFIWVDIDYKEYTTIILKKSNKCLYDQKYSFLKKSVNKWVKH